MVEYTYIEDLMDRKDITQEQKGECLRVFLHAKDEFRKQYGSCLDAPNYYEHMMKRKDYCATMVEVYLREHRQ